mgnify:CR=1 FL=1
MFTSDQVSADSALLAPSDASAALLVKLASLVNSIALLLVVVLAIYVLTLDQGVELARTHSVLVMTAGNLVLVAAKVKPEPGDDGEPRRVLMRAKSNIRDRKSVV